MKEGCKRRKGEEVEGGGGVESRRRWRRKEGHTYQTTDSGGQTYNHRVQVELPHTLPSDNPPSSYRISDEDEGGSMKRERAKERESGGKEGERRAVLALGGKGLIDIEGKHVQKVVNCRRLVATRLFVAPLVVAKERLSRRRRG